MAFGRNKKKATISKTINPGINIVFIGDVIKLMMCPMAPQMMNRNRAQLCPLSIAIPEINAMSNDTYILTYCTEIGRGLRSLSSFTFGLFKPIVHVITESPLVTIKIQAITVIDVGRFLIIIISSIKHYLLRILWLSEI